MTRLLTLTHQLNCGTRIGAEPSALHGAPSATDGYYNGCDVSLSIERQHADWNPKTHAWEPQTTTYQLSRAEALSLIGQLQEAL